MGSIKQKSRVRRQKKRIQHHKGSVILISAVVLLLTAIVVVNGVSLREKNKTYKKQEAELKEQLKEEQARSAEISELQKYVATDKFVEEIAKDKLGLVHENEILFKAAQ